MAHAVEDYLADLADAEDQAQMPAAEDLVLRVPSEVRDHALAAARASGMSLDRWATDALERAARSGG